jgi:hypothetical protein
MFRVQVVPHRRLLLFENLATRADMPKLQFWRSVSHVCSTAFSSRDRVQSDGLLVISDRLVSCVLVPRRSHGGRHCVGAILLHPARLLYRPVPLRATLHELIIFHSQLIVIIWRLHIVSVKNA